MMRLDDFVFVFAFWALERQRRISRVVHACKCQYLGAQLNLLSRLELFAFGHLAYRH